MEEKTLKQPFLLQSFCELVEKTTGLYFPKESWRDLEKKLNSISQDLGFKELNAFLRWFLSSPLTQDQIDLLAHHLTIGETYFFRDSQTFKVLSDKILPALIHEHKNHQSLRIWSAACCTGEEPYSISILLHELIPNLSDWDITILGTDINSQFLHKAEQGIYKEWSFRSTPKEIKNRYFSKTQEGFYLINSKVTNLVKLMYLNLVEDAYPSILNGTYAFDLILCNNVLIYFSSSQIQKVVNKLVNSLKDEGWLLVTAIEVPYIKNQQLKTIRYQNTTFFKKTSSLVDKDQQTEFFTTTQPIQVMPTIIQPSQPTVEFHLNPSIEEKSLSINSGKNLYEEAQNLYQTEHYLEAVEKLEQWLKTHPQLDTQRFIFLIKAYANQGNLELAKKWCLQSLRQDNLDPYLHYLHAYILQELNEIPESIQALKKTLYLDPNFVMAYFALGNLMLNQNKPTEAQRCFRNVLDLLKHSPSHTILPGEGEVTSGQLTDIVYGMISKENSKY